MNGYQLSFFTQQDRKFKNKPIAEWLIGEAKRLGITGATIFAGSEGFGHEGRLHSARFFDLSDQPLEIVMAAGVEESEQLFSIIKKEKVRIFYVKIPIEYGVLGNE
jgi:PII-like signaling protein